MKKEGERLACRRLDLVELLSVSSWAASLQRCSALLALLLLGLRSCCLAAVVAISFLFEAPVFLLAASLAPYYRKCHLVISASASKLVTAGNDGARHARSANATASLPIPPESLFRLLFTCRHPAAS